MCQKTHIQCLIPLCKLTRSSLKIQTTCLDIGICDSYSDALFPLVGKTNSGKYLKGIDGIFVNYIGFNLACLLVCIRL